MIAGIDIGGANIKFCTSDGSCTNTIFPLWKNKDALTLMLHQIILSKKIETLAVTITGELCDCFENKREGVLFLLNSLPRNSFKTFVWTIREKFIPLHIALESPLECAASNWLALATFIAKLYPKHFGISLDIGSTTTDVTWIENGVLKPTGITDPERLQSKGLIYTGMKRTPLGTFLGSNYAQEYFATIADAHLLVDNLQEDEMDFDTADCRSFTKLNAIRRIAKMHCADPDEVSNSKIMKTVRLALQNQAKWINSAIKIKVQKVEPNWVYISGSGEALAKKIVDSYPWKYKPDIFSFSDSFGSENSSAACAFSLLQLIGK